MSTSGEYRRGFPHGLMFHRFQASTDSGNWQGAITPEEFERILLYVGIERILSPEEWITRAATGRLGAADLCITFDDGLRCQVDHALPVLERLGLQAFWFVYSCVFAGHPVKSEIYSYAAGRTGGMSSLMEEFLRTCPPDARAEFDSPEFRSYESRMSEAAPFYSADDIKYRFLRNSPRTRRLAETLMDGILEKRGLDARRIGGELWLSEPDLKFLAGRGHCVGLHSYDHPYDMSALTRDEQQLQYERNFSHIASVTDTAPRSMSHPLNSYNADSLAVLTGLGIRCGFRANLLAPDSRGVNPSSLEFAREDSANLLKAIASNEAVARAAQ